MEEDLLEESAGVVGVAVAEPSGGQALGWGSWAEGTLLRRQEGVGDRVPGPGPGRVEGRQGQTACRATGSTVGGGGPRARPQGGVRL